MIILFNAIDENNTFKLGEIISVFKINNGDKEYALFSISNFDDDASSLQVGYLKKDSDGYDYLDAIEDEKELKKVTEVVKDMIEVNNGKQI